MLSELNFEFPPAQTFPRQRQSPSSLRPSPHSGDRTIPYAAPSPQPISLLPSSLSPSVPTDPSLRLSPHYVGPIAAFSTPSLASAQRRRPRRHLQKVSTCTVASRRQLPLTLAVSSTDDSCPLPSPAQTFPRQRQSPSSLRPSPHSGDRTIPYAAPSPQPISLLPPSLSPFRRPIAAPSPQPLSLLPSLACYRLASRQRLQPVHFPPGSDLYLHPVEASPAPNAEDGGDNPSPHFPASVSLLSSDVQAATATRPFPSRQRPQPEPLRAASPLPLQRPSPSSSQKPDASAPLACPTAASPHPRCLLSRRVCGRSRPDPSSFPTPSPASLSLSRPVARRVCTASRPDSRSASHTLSSPAASAASPLPLRNPLLLGIDVEKHLGKICGFPNKLL